MDTVTALKVVRPYLAGLAALGLLAGIIAKVAGRDAGAAAVWAAATLPVLLALLVEIVTSLRRGEVGLDIVAGLSMGAALTFGENLAAAIVALMYAGGPVSRDLCGKDGAAGDDGAAVAGAAHGDPPPRRTA